MAPDFQDKPKSKHRKSTCAGCRRRKSKCDGKTPKCTTCVAYKDECFYDKPPSLAYVRSLEEEVQELKAQLRQNNPCLVQPRSGTRHSSTAPSPVSEGAEIRSSSRAPQIPWPNRLDIDMSVDESGSITFHNSTSPLHESVLERYNHQAIYDDQSREVNDPDKQQRIRRNLALHAHRLRQIETFATARGAAKLNIPVETSQELLQHHWVWQHPLFLVLYRPAFYRGLAGDELSRSVVSNPYCASRTLLKVVHGACAESLHNRSVQDDHHNRLQQRDAASASTISRGFVSRMADEARIDVSADMLQGSSIPTAQALLLLSASELICGRSSQAWNISGAAFRMSLDLGIHLPGTKLQSFVESLTAEAVEVRTRLFWSCYTWDKISSLYLGRMPSFAPDTVEVPPNFMDESADTDMWSPYYGDNPPVEVSNLPMYPPCPGNVVSCFKNLCGLCCIINDMLFNMYSSSAFSNRETEGKHSPGHDVVLDEAFTRVSQALRHWLALLPSNLRIDLNKLPRLAPPPHIVSLNLLYHTTLILLHRPILLNAQDTSSSDSTRSWQTCTEATRAIHDLIMLETSTFGLDHLSFLSTYCAYVACTIGVLRFEREYHPCEDLRMLSQNMGLSFLLDVLQKRSVSMHAFERGNAGLRKRVKKMVELQKVHRSNVRRSHSSTPPSTRFSIPTPTSQQTDFTQQKLFGDNAHASVTYPQPGAWQVDMHTSIYSNHTFHGSEDYLPSFSGQHAPMNVTGQPFVDSVSDPTANRAFLGYNLNAHTHVITGEPDWSFMDVYNGNSQVAYK